MSEERRDVESVLSTDGVAAKRPWHAPDLHEVDVSDTEAGAGYPAADGTTYLS